MESLTWNKTDTDAVYAYMQEQERPAYMDTVRSVTAENGVPYLRFPMLESESFIEHGFSTRKGGVSTGIYESMNLTGYFVCRLYSSFFCGQPRSMYRIVPFGLERNGGKYRTGNS